MAIELGKRKFLIGKVVDRPGRFHRELHDACGVEPEGDRKARPLVALAVAAGDAVDGQHHHLHAGLSGTSHHVSVETAILVEIERINLRPLTDLTCLFERSEEQTSELPSLMRTQFADFCLKK